MTDLTHYFIPAPLSLLLLWLAHMKFPISDNFARWNHNSVYTNYTSHFYRFPLAHTEEGFPLAYTEAWFPLVHTEAGFPLAHTEVKTHHVGRIMNQRGSLELKVILSKLVILSKFQAKQSMPVSWSSFWTHHSMFWEWLILHSPYYLGSMKMEIHSLPP